MHTSSSFPPPPQGEHFKRVSHVPTLTNQKKAPPPHNPHYSFHPPLQKINHHSFESAMRNPNFQFDIFNIPFVEKPPSLSEQNCSPPLPVYKSGDFWRAIILKMAYASPSFFRWSPQNRFETTSSPLISLLIGLLLFLIIQMYEDERRTCFVMKKNIHKKMLSNRMNVY